MSNQKHLHFALLALLPLTSCQTTPNRHANDIHLIRGGPFPLLGITIEQTNFEIAFFEKIDQMLIEGLTRELHATEPISIEPISLWFVFSYPTNVSAKIETRVDATTSEMTGWRLQPNQAIRDSGVTNQTHSVLAIQRQSHLREPIANLTMLAQIKGSRSTNLSTFELSCLWQNGALKNKGLRQSSPR